MKKTYLLIIAAALAFAGCSKNGPDTPRDPNAWMYDESLPVPVLMGDMGAEPMTRAVVESIDNITIGIYGLDVSDGQDAWTLSGAYNKSSEKVNSILINNESATVTDGKVVFTNGTKYYPLNSNNKFNFYAYYPRKSTSANLKCSDDGTYFYADYTIGYDDILWDEAEATDFEYEKDESTYRISGYNAAYIRKINEYGALNENLPKLELQHKLTALKFKLYATKEAAQALNTAGAVITGLTIDDTYTKGSLIIADKRTTGNQKGKFITDEESIGKIALKEGGDPKFEISDFSSLPDLDKDDNTYTIDFGDELLLAPNPESKSFKGRLHIKLSGITQDLPIELTDPDLNGSGQNFEAGMRYTYTIKVKGPEEIAAFAELKEWSDIDGGFVDTDDEGEPID